MAKKKRILPPHRGILIYMPLDILHRLDEAATQSDTTRSDLIRNVLGGMTAQQLSNATENNQLANIEQVNLEKNNMTKIIKITGILKSALSCAEGALDLITFDDNLGSMVSERKALLEIESALGAINNDTQVPVDAIVNLLKQSADIVERYGFVMVAGELRAAAVLAETDLEDNERDRSSRDMPSIPF